MFLMKRPAAQHSAILLLGAALLLGGCSSKAPFAQTGTLGGGMADMPTDIPEDVFTVPEIPIAPNSEIIKEDTVIVGADDNWTGQVVMHAPYRVAQMTEFYRREMPKYGWTETSIVRARRTAISFIKDQRVVIVRISAPSDGVVEVDVVVSPNSVAEAQARQAPSPRPRGGSAPVTSVPSPRSKPN